MADRTFDVDTALRMMTIDAAYAIHRDTEVGSLEVGKYADLIVLSADPTAVPEREIFDIEVLMTMVGGRVEVCQDASVCPDTVTASTSDAPDPTPTTVAGFPDLSGDWTAADPDDGSQMWLFIQATGAPDQYEVTVYDDGTTICETEPPSPSTWSSIGTVTPSGVWEVEPADFVCEQGGIVFEDAEVPIRYDRDLDAMVAMSAEVVFARSDS